MKVIQTKKIRDQFEQGYRVGQFFPRSQIKVLPTTAVAKTAE